jgi:hypothetical protein
MYFIYSTRVAPEVIPPMYFHGNYNRYKEHNNTYLTEQILSYKTLFFDVVTTIGYALWPALNKSLDAAIIKICTSGGDSLFRSSYDGVVARKRLPTQFIFHRP